MIDIKVEGQSPFRPSSSMETITLTMHKKKASHAFLCKFAYTLTSICTLHSHVVRIMFHIILHQSSDQILSPQTSLHQLSTALKQSYVYLGRKVTLDSILNRVAVMRSEGPKKLLVRNEFLVLAL